jgi:hypothetical protein
VGVYPGGGLAPWVVKSVGGSLDIPVVLGDLR